MKTRREAADRLQRHSLSLVRSILGAYAACWIPSCDGGGAECYKSVQVLALLSILWLALFLPLILFTLLFLFTLSIQFTLTILFTLAIAYGLRLTCSEMKTYLQMATSFIYIDFFMCEVMFCYLTTKPL